MILPELVVYYIMVFAGFTAQQAHTMTCISHYESSHRPKALNLHLNENGSIDVGLLQVNSIWFGSSYYCEFDRLQNPIYNARCGHQIFTVQGFDAWYGYKYNKQKCDNYKVKGVNQ